MCERVETSFDTARGSAHATSSRYVRIDVVTPAARVIAAALVSTAAACQDARQLLEEAQRRSRSASCRYEGVLQAFDAAGRKAEKRWHFQRAGSHGESKTVIRFLAPPEVKGVAVLILNSPDRASSQWMWTPATGRVRRLATGNRATRFFGTDFSFEDLEERDVDQYDSRTLGETLVDGVTCWEIECRPRAGKASQYTHSRLWLRKDNYVLVRIENCRKDAVLRRIASSEVRSVQGIWTPLRVEISRPEQRTRTVLRIEKLEYNVPLDEAVFTLEGLRRGF